MYLTAQQGIAHRAAHDRQFVAADQEPLPELVRDRLDRVEHAADRGLLLPRQLRCGSRHRLVFRTWTGRFTWKRSIRHTPERRSRSHMVRIDRAAPEPSREAADRLVDLSAKRRIDRPSALPTLPAPTGAAARRDTRSRPQTGSPTPTGRRMLRERTSKTVSSDPASASGSRPSETAMRCAAQSAEMSG